MIITYEINIFFSLRSTQRDHPIPATQGRRGPQGLLRSLNTFQDVPFLGGLGGGPPMWYGNPNGLSKSSQMLKTAQSLEKFSLYICHEELRLHTIIMLKRKHFFACTNFATFKHA